jgi:hypothetical protein
VQRKHPLTEALIYQFRTHLTVSMVLDFALCFAVQQITKALFSNTAPKEIIARGSARREQRRLAEKSLQTPQAIQQNGIASEKKASVTQVPKYMPKA